MTDQPPASRKVPPLAIIVVVVLAALAAVAFANMHGATHPPRADMPAPRAGDTGVMPRQSTVPDTQQPASDERGAMGHRDNPNAPGGPATTADVKAAPNR